MKASDVSKTIRATLSDMVTLSMRGGIYTARMPYVYRYTSAPQRLADTIVTKLRQHHIEVDIVDKGDIWAMSNPKASLSRSSHVWVKFQVK